MLDSAIHWINHYPLDNSIGFASVYPLDSDLSGGQRYPLFEQLGPVFFMSLFATKFPLILCIIILLSIIIKIILWQNILD